MVRRARSGAGCPPCDVFTRRRPFFSVFTENRTSAKVAERLNQDPRALHRFDPPSRWTSSACSATRRTVVRVCGSRSGYHTGCQLLLDEAAHPCIRADAGQGNDPFRHPSAAALGRIRSSATSGFRHSRSRHIAPSTTVERFGPGKFQASFLRLGVHHRDAPSTFFSQSLGTPPGLGLLPANRPSEMSVSRRNAHIRAIEWQRNINRWPEMPTSRTPGPPDPQSCFGDDEITATPALG